MSSEDIYVSHVTVRGFSPNNHVWHPCEQSIYSGYQMWCDAKAWIGKTDPRQKKREHLVCEEVELYQEIIIPLKLYLDMVPSSSVDSPRDFLETTRDEMAGNFGEKSIYMFWFSKDAW